MEARIDVAAGSHEASPRDLSGQRIVVVGGGSRLGRAIALAASAAGADLVVAGRTPSALEAVVERAAGPAQAVVADLSEPSSIDQLGIQIGSFDHLVSTVSMHATGPLRDLTDEAIQRAIDAKLLGPLRLMRATVDAVRAGGSYTFFSGQAAWRPLHGASVTAMVNGGLAFLVRALAVEVAPIRVNAVAPGVIDSGALDRLGEDKAAFVARTAARTPVGRIGVPEDIVAATLMVLRNGFITGSVLHVDGGGPLA